MNDLIKIIYLSIVSLCDVIFSFSFLIIIIFIYFLITKLKVIDIYSFKNSNNTMYQLVESILQGIIIGIIGSILLIIIGIPINISPSFILMLPIAILLAIINPRFICFAYAGAILCFIGIVFRGQMIFGFMLPNIQVDITGILLLVGVLHLMESVLTYLHGSKYLIPIITKKEDNIIVGYIIQRFWPIPIALLVMANSVNINHTFTMPEWWPIFEVVKNQSNLLFLSVMPVIGLLGYRDICLAITPEQKSKKSAIMISVYSIIIIILSMLSISFNVFKYIGIIFMCVAHEFIIQFEWYKENTSKPLYYLPKKGVRVVSVCCGGIADRIGIRNGDIINKINGKEINNIKDYKEIILGNPSFIWMEIQKLDGRIEDLEYYNYNADSLVLGLKPLSNKPPIVIKYDSIHKYSIFIWIKKFLNKKI